MSSKQKIQKFSSLLFILAIILSSLHAPAVSAQSQDGLKRQVNTESGKVSFIGPESGQALPAARALGTFLRPQDPAMALARRFAPEFGIKDAARELTEMRSSRPEDGRVIVRYQQQYQGIPVMGGELIVNTNENGDLYSMSGEVSPGLSLQTQPKIDSAQATETALQALAKWYEISPADFNVSAPELWIFDESLLKPSTRPAELVWRMEVTPRELGMPLRELVLVNAERGSISLHFNQVDTAWTGATTSNHVDTLTVTAETFSPSDSEIGDNLVTDPTTTENMPALAPANLYVATTGNDSGFCTSAASPCFTINYAIGKATDEDTIKVAVGTYTGSGAEVVLINKSITLSGGWNASFTTQSGLSTIDGQGTRRGVTVNNYATATIERCLVQNAGPWPDSTGSGIYIDSNNTLTLNNSTVDHSEGAGINNLATLTLNNSTVSNSTFMGILNSQGTLTLNNSTVSGNTGVDSSGGIHNEMGTATLNNSTVSGNTNVGILNKINSTLILNNSTVSGNTGDPSNSGGGIFNAGSTTTLNNSTVSDNIATHGPGGGIYNAGGLVTLKNTIIAGNSAETSGPDCSGPISSAGYNLLGNTSGCTFASSMGDLTNVSPKLGELIGLPGYHPLQADSPAIEAGNPATPGSGGSACLANDERGVTRPVGTRCDIGAYEYTVLGSLSSLSITGGNNQHASPGSAFPKPLRVAALDSQGSPIANVSVTFTAPGSGASGTFADTGTEATTVVTNQSGIATTSIFTANAVFGSYTVVASAGGVESVALNLQNVVWYVATTGNDANNCQTPATPCKTMNGVLERPDFVAGDIVLVADGTYTGSGVAVVVIINSVILSGGWDATFTTQNGISTIDGESVRNGVYMSGHCTVSMDRFLITRGNRFGYGGIYKNFGELTLNNSIVSGNGNMSSYGSVGPNIYNSYGTLTLNNSSVSGNVGTIGNMYATLVLNNSTVSGNTVAYGSDAGGVDNYYGTVTLNNSTVTNNSAARGGGIYNQGGEITLQNSILAGNIAISSGQDGFGGGIINLAGTVMLNNSTVTNNSAARGGGIYNQGGEVTLQNSILAGNIASPSGQGGFGGGIINLDGTVMLNSSTVGRNLATYGGGIYKQGGEVILQNSILAGNIATSSVPDCYGTVGSSGYNLIGNKLGCTFSSTTGDLVGTSASPINPQFAPLLSPSWDYLPLLPNSPAINAGNTATCLATDQRGVTRPQGSACDIGAFEYQVGVIPAYIVAYAGTPQSLVKGGAASSPLKALVLDTDGDAVPGVSITFTAPAIGASVIFTDTGTNVSTASTDVNGIATSSTFTANNISGGYVIHATAGAGAGSAIFQLANISLAQVLTYTANNTSSLPGSLLCNQAAPNCTNGINPHADAAHKFAIGTHDLYVSKHGRDSLDNAGMTIISTVHYGSNYHNAFWDGTQAVYGDGNGWPLADDVVAHELTHGVTQYESNLLYYYQSGAINESFSDLWGEYYDQTNGLGSDAEGFKWLVSEDIETDGSGAIRSMSNPTFYGDPDRMTSWYYYTGDDDDGGVHTNSGVNNKAVSLMVDGGSFNVKTVAALGWDKTAAIYYEVNTHLLSSGSDYSDLYYALQEACKDLTGQFGITSFNCDQVKNALDAVEMNSRPYVVDLHPDAPVCAPGLSPTPRFKDEFESGTGNWDILGASHWSWKDWYATSGTHMMWGDDYYDSSDSQLTMKNGVYLPPGSSYYLHFKHAFLFEYEDYTFYDGGVLEYSLNNGATWSDAAPLFWAGQNYNGTLYYSPGSSNVLKGRMAFVGNSHGYVSSQYNLSSLSGQTVKFSWRFATDQYYYFMGWTLDDVQIYKCDSDPHISGDAGVPGVALSYMDGTPKVAYSDWRGKYSLAVSNGWSGTVTPSLTGFTFDPPNRSYTSVTSNKVDQDYTALVTLSGNTGVAGVTLSYIDGMPKTVITNSSGNYSIAVPYGWSGIVTPSRTGFTFVPAIQTYTNLTVGQSSQNYLASWVGGITIQSDQNVVAVGRPHVGSEVASYGGFTNGSLTAYVPMLFKGAFGGAYNAALYVQNVHDTNTANITIKYYDSNGVLNCTKADTLTPLASKGYWVPTVTCDTGSLPSGWVGGVVVTSNLPIVAVGRPHVGSEVMTYNGFASGSLSTYVPMLFKGAFGGSYNAAFYVQNTHESNTASITIKYYDSSGLLNCTKADTVAPLASKGYWVPTATCDTGSLPAGWVGGVVVTSDQPIVAVGRPHIGSQVTTYTGLSSGSLGSYVPMLFKGAYGSYDAAFYVQNVHETDTANITIQYYDSTGTLNCTKTDTIAPLASKGYWVPTATCTSGSLPAAWIGGVVVTSDQPIVTVGRPHLGAQVTTYNGFTDGNLNAYLPMLFRDGFGGSYDSALYLQNLDSANTANLTIKLYDASGNLACTLTDTLSALASKGYWLPGLTCIP